MEKKNSDNGQWNAIYQEKRANIAACRKYG